MSYLNLTGTEFEWLDTGQGKRVWDEKNRKDDVVCLCLVSTKAVPIVPFVMRGTTMYAKASLLCCEGGACIIPAHWECWTLPMTWSRDGDFDQTVCFTNSMKGETASDKNSWCWSCSKLQREIKRSEALWTLIVWTNNLESGPKPGSRN